MRGAYNDYDGRAELCGYMQNNKYTHTRTHVISIIDPPKGGSIRMAYNVKDDRAGLCNLINTHTHVISIIGTPLGGSLRVA